MNDNIQYLAELQNKLRTFYVFKYITKTKL